LSWQVQSEPHAPARGSALESKVSPLATSLSLFAADIASILIARYVALVVWHRVNPGVTILQDFGIWLTAALFPLVYASMSLYSARGWTPVEELRRICLGSALVSLVLTTTTFLAKDFTGYSRGLFLSSFLLVSFLVPMGRAVLRHFCGERAWWGVPVLILGAGRTAQVVVEGLKSQPHLGFKPVACLSDSAVGDADCAGVPIAGGFPLAAEIGRKLKIDHLLIAMPGLERGEITHAIERWGATFGHVLVIPNLFGLATLWVSTRDLGGILGLEVRQNLLIPWNQWFKRSVDLLGAVVIGAVALPILVVAALWIAIASPGSVFYRQEREGRRGKLIRICKLRTMYPDAENLLSDYLAGNAQARDEWQRHVKLKSDPRVLPGIGKFLRRTGLDELPQIWSVLKGEMSIVGPRPFPAYHLEQFPPEFRELRRRVTPGLTGLWQVSSRSDADLKAQEALDVYYIRNWSLWLDLYILARTVGAVLMGRGAY
jgi:Undecaprenyl-phosphate galactose phosphotransferase WbaP